VRDDILEPVVYFLQLNIFRYYFRKYLLFYDMIGVV